MQTARHFHGHAWKLIATYERRAGEVLPGPSEFVCLG
jgi:hypothetical protein